MTEFAEQIRANFQLVEAQIHEALVSCGREGQSVKLVVVTKGQSVEKMQALIDAGGRCLGENYPEETAGKIEMLAGTEALEWHMIGHIQSRKIKFLTRYFDVVQSVDSLETAARLDTRFAESGRKVAILLEVNISGETSKQGFALSSHESWSEFSDEVQQIQEMPFLELGGLMTMPPLGSAAESSRLYFRRCKELLGFVNDRMGENKLTELSMGTSFDYRVAVEEGATMVRVGEAIMGARNYS